ncbi:MAG TPA: TSUP family transporter, partial [Acidimicrobiales bacterium]|nr:TSUP family transporter [Acidimicrobiales bacterium]
MLAATLPAAWREAIFVVAGVVGGVANGVAGGGTFVTFPTLLALGVPALRANLSTTVGVTPSYFAGVATMRGRVGEARERLALLLAPAVAGALVGCALLFAGSAATFRAVVPYLIGAATAVFAAAPWLTRRLGLAHPDSPRRR